MGPCRRSACALGSPHRGAAGNAASSQPCEPAALLDLPPPADSGKPRYFAPRDLPPPPGCTAVLDCRFKVIGTLQHNGAVEVNGAFFKW
jgi:hypothetical protein